MNKFCKRALSELLGLKLGSCPIEKRLKPVVDYLDRHRVALHKYVYPECYKQIMENLWDYLLQVRSGEGLLVWWEGCGVGGRGGRKRYTTCGELQLSCHVRSAW